MKTSTLVIIVTVTLTCLLVSEVVDASPGRKGGGWGGRKSSSSSRGSYGGYGSSSNYGKKKKGIFTKKNLGRAAILGATAYGSYQLGKLAGKFSGFHGHGGYGFNDWNRWRAQDGFLCRNSQDCQWIDRNLHCEDYELNFTPMNAWFGGDIASITGECECDMGMYWVREVHIRVIE